MKLEYHIIINSNSGSGNGKRTGEELLAVLKEKQETFTSYFTTYAGEELEITRKLAENTLIDWEEGKDYERFPLLVVLGGDGTLHQVINALDGVSKKIPVGYVPGGSGNDFARGVGIVRNDVRAAFEQIQSVVKPKEINVLHFEEKNKNFNGSFVNNFGIGIDASVVQATNESASKKTLNRYKLGSLSYVFTMLGVLFKQKTFPVTVTTTDGSQTFDKTFLATTTNHPYFGGGVAILPGADAHQKQVDLILIEKKNWLQVFRLLAALPEGKHLAHPDTHCFSGDWIKLTTKTLQYGQIDGEGIDQQEFDLTFTPETRYIWF